MPQSIYKLTASVQAKICDAFRVGGFLGDAAALAGVNRDTLSEWLQRGQEAAAAAEAAGLPDPDGDSCVRLWRAVEAARAEGKVKVIKHLFTKGSSGKGWMASEAWLRRRYPGEWGDRMSVEHSGTIDTAIEITVLTSNDLTGIAGLLGTADMLQLGTGEVIDQAPENEL